MFMYWETPQPNRIDYHIFDTTNGIHYQFKVRPDRANLDIHVGDDLEISIPNAGALWQQLETIAASRLDFNTRNWMHTIALEHDHLET